MRSARARLGVVVFPGSCDQKSQPLLSSLKRTFASRRNSTYRWFFVSKSLEEVRSGFEKSDIRWDTSVTAIVPEEDSPRDRNVFDIYKTSDEFLSAHQVGHWQRGALKNWLDAEYQPFRKNMHGERITFGLIVTRFRTWDDSKLQDMLDLPPSDPGLPDEDCQLMPYNILRITSEILNYTVVRIKGFYGIGRKQPNGTFSELLHSLQSDEVQVSATNIILVDSRRVVLKYLNSCYYFRNILVYLSTNTFSTPTALIEPFSYGIWLVIGLVLLVGCLVVTVATFYESEYDQQPREISIGKSSLIMLGIMNGQGEPAQVSWSSSYALLIVLLVFGIVVNCAYSAVIVRFLLAEPSPNYPTTAHLMKSSLKVAAHDFFYYRNSVFGPNILPAYRELQNKKMQPPGGFKLIGTAVDGLLKGRWALLVADTILYPLVRTASPQKKCRMFEVSDVPQMQIPLCTPIYRESPMINMLNRGFTLLRERGLFGRAVRMWLASRPNCVGGGAREWSSVPVKVTSPALFLMFFGVFGSTFLLFLEKLLYRFKSGLRKRKRAILQAAI